SIGFPRQPTSILSTLTFQEQFFIQVGDQLLHPAGTEKFPESFEIERPNFSQRVLAVEMLNDEKIVERQNELVLAQSGRIPQDHVLLLTLFDRRKLKITKSGVLCGVLGCTGRHDGPL